MDSYFASVEQHLDPSLRGKPVAVAPVMAESSCCIAASYEAKAFGVKTGTGVAEARKLCPGIAIVESKPSEYIRFHHRIVEVVEDCIHVEEVLSIDEMWAVLPTNLREPRHVRKLEKNAEGENQGRDFPGDHDEPRGGSEQVSGENGFQDAQAERDTHH